MVCRHFHVPSAVWLCCRAKKCFSLPASQLSTGIGRRKWQKGRQLPALCLKNHLFSPRPNPSSSPRGERSPRRPHVAGQDSLYPEVSISASLLFQLPWSASGPRGVWPCRGGNRMDRRLMADGWQETPPSSAPGCREWGRVTPEAICWDGQS